MDKPKNLEYFMKLNYNVILRKNAKLYYLFIPELSLIVEDLTLKNAYEKLEKKKEEYFKKIVALNAQHTVNEPVTIALRKKLFMDLISFFSKGLIILFCLFVIFSFMMGSLPNISKRIGYSFARKLSAEIFTKLDNMTIEDNEKIKVKLRRTLRQVKPFVNEFKILFEDDTNNVKDKDASIGREAIIDN